MKKLTIIYKEYWAFLAFLMAIGMFITGGYTLFDEEGELAQVALFFVISLISTAATVKRLGTVGSIVQDGNTVSATVTDKRRWKSSWIVKFNYTVDGVDYMGKNVLVGFNLPFEMGSGVTVSYPRENPKKSFIKDIYKF